MCTDVFDDEESLVYTGVNDGSDHSTCPRCRRELFGQDSVVGCTYDDCPNLDAYSDLLGLD